MVMLDPLRFAVKAERCLVREIAAMFTREESSICCAVIDAILPIPPVC